jgi:N-acetylneuraminic acid mutarotase
MGQVAGIGGLALGVFLFLFRDIIRKNIFPTLNPEDAFRLLRLILVLIWGISFAGLIAWVYISGQHRREEDSKQVHQTDIPDNSGRMSTPPAPRSTTPPRERAPKTPRLPDNQGKWSFGSPMPTARMGAFTGVIDNKVYVVGGENNDDVLSVNEIYDPATDTWMSENVAPMPTARWLGASAVVDGILYTLGGGTRSGPSTAVEAYDPKTNTWSRKRPMPPLGGNNYAVVQGKTIYVVGGLTNGASDGVVWTYDASKDAWTRLTSLNIAKRLAAVGALGPTIVAEGGLTNSGVTDDNEGYDANTNKWSILAAMPIGRQGGCFAAVGTLLYYAGGHDEGVHVTKVLEAYNAKTDRWITGLASMPEALANPGSAEAFNRLYCFGGSSNSLPFTGHMFDSVQIYQPPAVF